MPENKTGVELSIPIPATGQEMPTELSDQRQYFADISKNTPRDKKAEESFIRSKIHLVMTDPRLDDDARESALAELNSMFGASYPSMLEQVEIAAASLGVGYGVYFTDPFRKAYATGTGLFMDIVCPTKAGGNVTNFLYLTAMNRAALGIEAFVSYWAQTDFHFKVFDWARKGAGVDPWVLDIPFSNLGNYIGTQAAHGAQYPVISVMNYTFELSPGTWKNEAWLWNRIAFRWDLMYVHAYTATHAGQVGGYTGSWGPIVEVFQSLHAHTNRNGFLNIAMNARAPGGQWGSWAYLGPTESYIRSDNMGIRPLFLDPNYSFVTYS